jgi:hypothetical protein
MPRTMDQFVPPPNNPLPKVEEEEKKAPIKPAAKTAANARAAKGPSI